MPVRQTSHTKSKIDENVELIFDHTVRCFNLVPTLQQEWGLRLLLYTVLCCTADDVLAQQLGIG